MSFKFEISYQKGGVSGFGKSSELRKSLASMEKNIKKLEKSYTHARIKIDDVNSQFHNRPGYLITLRSGEKKIVLFKIYYFKKLNENDNEYRVPVGPELPGDAYYVFDANRYRYKIIREFGDIFFTNDRYYILDSEIIIGDLPRNTVFVKKPEIRKCQNYLESNENPDFHYANDEIKVLSKVNIIGFWRQPRQAIFYPENVEDFFGRVTHIYNDPDGKSQQKWGLPFSSTYIKVKDDEDNFGIPNVTVQSNLKDDRELLKLFEDKGADESKS